MCLNVFSSLSDCFAKDKGPWIIKPVASSRGRGIYLVSNVSDQQFSIVNVHVIALISPGFASVPAYEAAAHQMQSDTQSEVYKSSLLLISVISPPGWHVDITSAVRTGMCWIFLLPVLASAFPSQHTENLSRAAPFLHFSTDAREKGSSNSGNKVSWTKMGHPEEQHLCPRLWDLKYSISIRSKRNLFPIKYFDPYFIWFGPIFSLFYTWVEADAAHATSRSKHFEARASRWSAQAADRGVCVYACVFFSFSVTSSCWFMHKHTFTLMSKLVGS